MRALFFPVLVLLLAGCAHQRPAGFDPATFRSPGMERCLQYWTVTASAYAVNHYHVYATDVDRGDLVQALVYWREGGRLLDYSEVAPGDEAQAWRLRPKVDRSRVLTDERISGSNDLLAHGVWVRWVKRCITKGKEYVVTLKDAEAAFSGSK